ncbi:MAG: hypothetical protein KKC76_20055 [Proteobacteria bacterium]|nr:hypothetical protein [Pseudomonadota bacterium]MBU4294683.1 hypothetical protein [Pseudomonadota bacterium]MCG2748595.1 hypothetical protein [Desulfobulbaceae bacterium]
MPGSHDQKNLRPATHGAAGLLPSLSALVMKESEIIDKLRCEIKRLRSIIAATSPDLPALLKTRGLTIYKSQPAQDLLLPDASHLDSFYRKLLHYSFRIFLRDVIKHQQQFSACDVTRYTSPAKAAEYIDFLTDVGLLEKLDNPSFRLAKRPIRSFGATLEWLLAEIIKRELGAEAMWGVKFRRQETGGDYDILAKINCSLLLYMESKSSPPKQMLPKHIAAFLDRIGDLHPDISIFFMDTQLRMKDKIVPMFAEELARRNDHPPQISRVENELFAVGSTLFIMNSSGSIRGNIERILMEFFNPDRQ